MSALDVVLAPVASLAGLAAGVGLGRNVRCHDAKLELRESGRDPDAPVAASLGAPLAHAGELAAERRDCNVVRAIADQLRAINEPATLDRYLHDAG